MQRANFFQLQFLSKPNVNESNSKKESKGKAKLSISILTPVHTSQKNFEINIGKMLQKRKPLE